MKSVKMFLVIIAGSLLSAPSFAQVENSWYKTTCGKRGIAEGYPEDNVMACEYIFNPALDLLATQYDEVYIMAVKASGLLFYQTAQGVKQRQWAGGGAIIPAGAIVDQVGNPDVVFATGNYGRYSGYWNCFEHGGWANIWGSMFVATDDQTTIPITTSGNMHSIAAARVNASNNCQPYFTNDFYVPTEVDIFGDAVVNDDGVWSIILNPPNGPIVIEDCEEDDPVDAIVAAFSGHLANSGSISTNGFLGNWALGALYSTDVECPGGVVRWTFGLASTLNEDGNFEDIAIDESGMTAELPEQPSEEFHWWWNQYCLGAPNFTSLNYGIGLGMGFLSFGISFNDQPPAQCYLVAVAGGH